MDQEAVERPSRANSPLGRAAFVSVILIVMLALSYFFVDRQLAIALRPYTNGVPFFVWLTYISTPLAPSASILAAFISGRALARGNLTDTRIGLSPRKLRDPDRRCLDFQIEGGLRTHLAGDLDWQQSLIFRQGTYGFFPFHGGQGYRAIPSGHTAAIAAAAGAAWCLWGRIRWLCVIFALAVAIGLLGSDYRWLSDIVAGAIVGVTTGVVAAKIGRRNLDTV